MADVQGNMSEIGFKADEIEDSPNEFSMVDPGKYRVIVIESEVRPTRKGDGRIMMLTLQICDGASQNRRLWDNILVNHPSEIAMRIANEKLKGLYAALGLNQISDTSELHNKPLTAIVKHEVRKDNGETQERVSGYLVASAAGEVAPPMEVKASAKPW